jgi:hypothetical protein
MASVQADAARTPVRRPHLPLAFGSLSALSRLVTRQIARLRLAGGFFDDMPHEARPHTPLAAQHKGFSLHAGLWVEAKRRKKLERLLRYGSRPPLPQKRLSVTPSGKVRLKLRKPYYTGQTELVLEPTAFLRRLFAIISPPRWHLTRYHGIFSGHHLLRGKLAALLRIVADFPDAARSQRNERTEDDDWRSPRDHR